MEFLLVWAQIKTIADALRLTLYWSAFKIIFQLQFKFYLREKVPQNNTLNAKEEKTWPTKSNFKIETISLERDCGLLENIAIVSGLIEASF